MIRVLRLMFFMATASIATSQALYAQQLQVSGLVTDGTGVVPGATVALRDPVGTTTEIRTNEQGRYRFETLRPGSYEITVSREGFTPSTRAFTLGAESRTIDLTLQVSGLFTTIEVTDVAGRGTASGMDIPNREVPNYVVGVTAEILQEQGANELSAALANISGVMTQVQYGAYEWYTIGGISQQSGNDFLYVDGMTLTGNRSATQLNNIEKVEVLKGPNSILYGGSGAGQGGMVNLIRKKPQSRPVHDAQYRAGGWGLHELAMGSAGTVFSFEKLIYRIDSAFSTRDGWRQNAADRFNFSPALTYLINPRMRVSATQSLTRDRYTLDAGVPQAILNRPGLPYDKKLNPAGDFQLARDWQNKLDFTWNITDRLTASHTFFSDRKRDQYLDAETLTYVAAQDQVNRTYLYFQHNRRPVQDITDLTGDFYLWGMRHRFMARYEYADQDNFSYRTGNAPGANNSGAALPLTPVPVQSFIDGTWVDDAPTYTEFPITRIDYSSVNYHRAVFQDQFNPVRYLGFNISMNRSRYRRETHNDDYDGSGNLTLARSTSRTTHNTKSNYRAGVTLIPQEDWPELIRGFQPYVSYNSSFNPTNNLQPDGTPLNPIINESIEVGNKWLGLNNRLNILTAFRRIEDKNRTISLPGGWFEQVGTSTTYNADLDIQGDLGHGISVIANYGYADSRIGSATSSTGSVQPNAGRRFPHAPKHTSRVWLTKRFFVRDNTLVTVSLGGQYVYRYFLNTANTTMIPSRSTMDGGVNVRHGRYDVAVNFENITDKDRYFVSQWAGNLYPGKPFNATLTLRYRFQD